MEQESRDDQIIYARARPEEIRIRELYRYGLDISANAAERPAGEPEGMVEIGVPCDGYRYFTRQALRDVRQQGGPITRRGKVQIGHLALAEPMSGQRRDPWSQLETRWRIEPVRLPAVQSADVKGGGQRCAVRHSYLPVWPAASPLVLEVSVFDDEIFIEDVERYMQAISQWRGSEMGLLLCFRVRVVLPNWLPVDRDGQPALSLTSLRLNWPTVPAAEHLRIVALGDRPRELCWLYDPELRAAVCGKNRLEWQVSEIPGRAAHKFETELLVHVRHPGELYLEPALTGAIGVTVDGVLLSGRQAVCFDALGRQAGLVARRTDLIGEFEIYLEDCFKQRRTATYWSLTFDGVELNVDRVADVRNALRDLGYRVIPGIRFDLEQGRHLLQCERWEVAEGGLARLDLLLVGQPASHTRWEQQVPGDARFSTVLRTSRLVIHLRGQLKGGSGSLTEGINHLQQMLKERLHPMAAVQ